MKHNLRVPTLFSVLLALCLCATPFAQAQWFDGGALVSSADGGRFLGGVLSDGGGGAFVSWADYRSGMAPSLPDAFAQHIRGDGTVDPSWPTAGLRLCPAGGSKYGARLESDDGGGFIAVWRDYRDPLPDSSWVLELYANRFDAAGSIAPGWPIEGLRLSSVRSYGTPVLTCPDGAGGVYVAWESAIQNQYGQYNEGDLQLQRVSANGTIAAGWPSDGIAITKTPYGEYLRASLSDGSGGAYLVWDADADGHSHAIRIAPDATVSAGWPEVGIDLSNERSFGVTGVAAEGGGLILFWAPSSAAYPPLGLKATRINSDGTIASGWPAAGLTVSSLGASQPLSCAGTSDGGVVVVWARFTPGQVAIYAQKVAPNGTVPEGWPLDGIEIVTNPSYLQGMIAASDGNGGAYLVWEENYSAANSTFYGSAVMALHLEHDGMIATGWRLGGTRLSDERSQGYGAGLISAPGRTAIVAWSSYSYGRDGSAILTQKLLQHGPESFTIGLVRSDARPDRVRVRWRPNPLTAAPVTPQRRKGSEPWINLASLSPDATGDYALEDWAIIAGETYEYRLSIPSVDRVWNFGEVNVSVPRLAMAIHAATIQRGASGFMVDVELPSAGPARIVLVDVLGRAVDTLHPGNLGAGIHQLRLGNRTRMAAGVYFVRVEQGDRSVSRRFVVLH